MIPDFQMKFDTATIYPSQKPESITLNDNVDIVILFIVQVLRMKKLDNDNITIALKVTELGCCQLKSLKRDTINILVMRILVNEFKFIKK